MSNRHIKNAIFGVIVLWICFPSILAIQLSGATLYQSRGELVGVTVGDIAIFAGGDAAAFDCDMFSGSTQNWTYTNLGASVRPSAVAVGPYALLAGGTFADNTVHLFNSTSMEWSDLALKSERHSLAATSMGSLAMFGGGVSSDYIDTDVIDVFNIDSESWSTMHLSAKRYKLAAASAGHYALFAGGVTADGQSDIVDIYNANTNNGL